MKKRKKKLRVTLRAQRLFKNMLYNQYIFVNTNFDFKKLVLYRKNITQFGKLINLIRNNEKVDYIVPSTFRAYQRDKQIKPFWTADTATLSSKLFLPINENINSQPNLLIEFSNYVFCNKIYVNKKENPFKLRLTENPINDEQPTINTIMKTKIINLFPTKIQRKTLKRMIGTYRYFYNRTIEYLNNYNKEDRTSYFYVYPIQKNEKVEIVLPKTKTYISNNEEKTVNLSPYEMKSIRVYLKTNKPNWLMENYPSHLIDQAINEACIAFRANLNKYIQTGIPFKIKYKKKEKINTIKIDSTFMSKNKNSLFSRLKVNGKQIFSEIRASEKFYKFGKKMTNLSWDSINNKWKLFIPVKATRSKASPIYQIGAVDPGIRKFGVIYSENHVIKLGMDADKKIYKVCKEIDIIKSRMNRKSYYNKNKVFIMNAKRRRNLKRALYRRLAYLKNLKNELHNKTVNYMCKNYKKIIYPHFETQKMAGKLHSKLARSMYNLSFYMFKQKLINKCKEYGNQLYLRSEAYTSKTCTNCGFINNNLGRSEEYNCPRCKIKIDRDINGARNILLKNKDCI